jgi:hypothetical protein
MVRPGERFAGRDAMPGPLGGGQVETPNAQRTTPGERGAHAQRPQVVDQVEGEDGKDEQAAEQIADGCGPVGHQRQVGGLSRVPALGRCCISDHIHRATVMTWWRVSAQAIARSMTAATRTNWSNWTQGSYAVPANGIGTAFNHSSSGMGISPSSIVVAYLQRPSHCRVLGFICPVQVCPGGGLTVLSHRESNCLGCQEVRA